MALGGTIQPMRGSLRGMEIPDGFLTYASGPKLRQQRSDELVRFINRGKISPPFGGGLQQDGQPDSVKISAEALD